MKKIIFVLFFLISILAFNSAYSYENQGFKSYTEGSREIIFECEKQCFIVLGERNDADYVEFSGKMIGSGVFGYGFIKGQSIIPGKTIQLLGAENINTKLVFNSLNYYSQLTDDLVAVVIIDGEISSNNFNAQLKQSSFSDKIGMGWNSFWTIESLTPYSINLRYGVKILGTSIVKYGYLLFIIFLIISLFHKKYRRLDTYLIFGLSIFLFIGFRNLITYSSITNTGLRTFTNAGYEEKRFFDLGDYIVFTDKVIDSIDRESCSIYMESVQDWPFRTHMGNVYLRPCNFVSESSEADYAIYYKKDYNKEIKGEILVDYNNSYLIKLSK